jgi:putative DNA modification/repair radical SAM protein
MIELVEVARQLRQVHKFAGYIHLKTIPDCDPLLLEQAGQFADRLSINVELPTDDSVGRLAPEKKPREIRRAMANLRLKIEEKSDPTLQTKRRQRFAPGGQSTQMIIGADASNDAIILKSSARLYGSYRLRRVYYSAFSPIPDATSGLPLIKPPLMREHRLYQADWLMRFYGFAEGEIIAGRSDGMLDLTIDPKLAWALDHREQFPVDINRADKETLLRVPGLGTKAVAKILQVRRFRTLRLDDLSRLCQSVAKVRPFVTTLDWHPGGSIDRLDLRQRMGAPATQLSLF